MRCEKIVIRKYGQLHSGDTSVCHIVLKQFILSIFLIICLSWPSVVVADLMLSYTVTIEGLNDRALRKILEAISDTVALRERPPASLNLLRRRADRDIPLFVKALRSQSFYAAHITVQIDAGTKPIKVKFMIDTGPPYLLKSVDVKISDDAAIMLKLPEAKELGLSVGEPAKSKSILDAEKVIIQWFKKNGFPFAQISERKVIVDHAEHNVLVTFQVLPGSMAQFGSTIIMGLESVDEAFLRKKIPWEEGERFNAELIKEAHNRLTKTGLFAIVHVKAGESLDEKGRLPVIVEVRERKHRTIKAGISYKTDEGLGGKISWEHRNLLGSAERLSTAFTISEIALAAEGKFRKPAFLHPDQSLLLDVRIADDHPDAFTSRNISSALLLNRTLSKEKNLTAGLAFRISEIDQFDQKEKFGLLSVPIQFNWDTSDTLIDPTRGGRLSLKGEPYYDTFSGDLGFIKGYASFSLYATVVKSPFIVLAFRTAIGAMAGANRDAIPADIRYYAGGGGSIRGYAYQSVGPLRGNDPIGGRSLLEISTELRIKVTKSIGIVTFIDGGSAFAAEFPDFKEDLRWGAGVGLRYFTPIGPLRLDVGIPLNPRKDIDDSFQIYVSLGQAF